jgi:ubiquinone/menaquinone biosynthesis C-methylase UbiE
MAPTSCRGYEQRARCWTTSRPTQERNDLPKRMRPELAAIDVARMHGLEIGPLASPRVRKNEGPVRYVDHASAAELKEKYATDQGMRDRLDEIVDVDYVLGQTTTISEAVAKDAPFDYVIASHVIEHIPDPIGWMDDLTRVLRPGGILSLVIPDKRYCFDINRSLTEISDLVDGNLRQLRQPGFRQAYDFYSKAIGGTVDTAAVWAGTADYSLAVRQDFADSDVAALEACRHMLTSDEFVDVHCHVFTPDSFLRLVEKMARLDLIDYEVAAFHPTQLNNFEFYVSLRLLDASRGRDVVRNSQLASVARTLGASARPTAAQPNLVRMEVSKQEERLIAIKRRSLARVRSLLHSRWTSRRDKRSR